MDVRRTAQEKKMECRAGCLYAPDTQEKPEPDWSVMVLNDSSLVNHSSRPKEPISLSRFILFIVSSVFTLFISLVNSLKFDNLTKVILLFQFECYLFKECKSIYKTDMRNINFLRYGKMKSRLLYKMKKDNLLLLWLLDNKRSYKIKIGNRYCNSINDMEKLNLITKNAVVKPQLLTAYTDSNRNYS